MTDTTSTELAPVDIDPDLDLVLERRVDVPPSAVWAAWTRPEHLVKWFTPKPWETVDCEIDLRPGGVFRTTMRSPEGEDMDGGAGCYLEVVENERLVWTTALTPGYRPGPTGDDMPFTAVIEMTPDGDGTLYRAVARHRDPDGCTRHAEMGFAEGWGAAFDQLVELARTF